MCIVAVEIAGIAVSISFHRQLPAAVSHCAAHFGRIPAQHIHQIVDVPDGQLLPSPVPFQIPVKQGFVYAEVILIAHSKVCGEGFCPKGLQASNELQIIQIVIIKEHPQLADVSGGLTGHDSQNIE